MPYLPLYLTLPSFSLPYLTFPSSPYLAFYFLTLRYVSLSYFMFTLPTATVSCCFFIHLRAWSGCNLGPESSIFRTCEERLSNTLLYHLRQISTIRRSLTTPVATSLMNAFLCSRVDYGNAIWADLTSYRINQLQSLLNAAVRLISGILKLGHISKLMWEELVTHGKGQGLDDYA